MDDLLLLLANVPVDAGVRVMLSEWEWSLAKIPIVWTVVITTILCPCHKCEKCISMCTQPLKKSAELQEPKKSDFLHWKKQIQNFFGINLAQVVLPTAHTLKMDWPIFQNS